MCILTFLRDSLSQQTLSLLADGLSAVFPEPQVQELSQLGLGSTTLYFIGCGFLEWSLSGAKKFP